MNKRLEELPKLAEEAKKESKKYFLNLKKRTPKNLDVIMQELHDAEFNKTDCLSCGNCCKTTSPIFTEKDVERISKHLKMKVVDFEGQYYFPMVPVISVPYDRYVQDAPVAVSTGLKDHKVVVVRGHGVYAVAETINLAYKWSCSVELSAKTAWLEKQIN